MYYKIYMLFITINARIIPMLNYLKQYYLYERIVRIGNGYIKLSECNESIQKHLKILRRWSNDCF